MKQLSCGTRALTVKLRQHTNTDVHTDTLKRVRNVLRGKKNANEKQTNRLWYERRGGGGWKMLFYSSLHIGQKGKDRIKAVKGISLLVVWHQLAVGHVTLVIQSGETEDLWHQESRILDLLQTKRWSSFDASAVAGGNRPKGWEGLGSGNKKLPVKKRTPPPQGLDIGASVSRETPD